MILANAIVLAIVMLVQADSVQFFAGMDGCYGDGTVYVVREAVNECDHGDGGWGTARMECYSNGELYHRCGVTIELTCCSADLDQDGDVDLRDFGMFVEQWTCPEEPDHDGD